MDRAQSRSSFDDPHNLSLQDIHHFDNNSTDSLSLLSHSNHASRADPSHAIDINAIGAGLQRYIPPSSHNSYIPLPPGVDPATVDFRTFYPYNPDQVKHRKRTTRSQLKVLEDRFKHETKPNAMIRKKLAAELGMTPRGVQVWFQNRRAKEKALAKKLGSGSINNKSQDAIDAGYDDNGPVLELEQNGDGSSSSNTQLSSGSIEPSPDSNPPSLPLECSDLSNSLITSSGLLHLSRGDDGHGLLNYDQRRNSCQNSTRSTSPMGTPTMNSIPIAEENIMNKRRPSLPAHFGSGLPDSGNTRSLSAFRNRSAWANGSFPDHDPMSAGRFSLGRLATHPYAHFTLEANGAVYGHNHFRPPSQQQVHSQLPFGQSSSHLGSTSNGGLYQLQLDAKSRDGQSSVGSLEAGDFNRHLYTRPELMHRGSLPAHASSLGFSQSTSNGTLGAPPHTMRFPREGHLYAFTQRSYRPPVAGPLPAPDYQFGTCVSTPTSSESENDMSAGLQHYTLSAGSREGEKDGEDRSLTQRSDPYASRFSSIASIAESESSVTSAAFSEASYDVRPSTSHSYQDHSAAGFVGQDDRRGSCSGEMLSMFSQLGMHGQSTTSLGSDPHAAESTPPRGLSDINKNGLNVGQGEPSTTFPSPASTVSAGNAGSHSHTPENSVSMAQPNDLTFAFQGVEGVQQQQQQQPQVQQPVALHPNEMAPPDIVSLHSDSDGLSFSTSHRSSMSSSGSSLLYPPSASSSRSSLGLHFVSRPSVVIQDNDGLIFDDIDEISVTGHYSPVSHPPTSFDFHAHTSSTTDLLSTMGGQSSEGMPQFGQQQQQQTPPQQPLTPQHGQLFGVGKEQTFFPPLQETIDFGMQVGLGDDRLRRSTENVGPFLYN